MARVLTAEAQPISGEMPATSEAVLAEALFASPVQASESPDPDRVRRAVGTTLRRLTIAGCAAQVAAEYGEHPDTAVARMRWALDTVCAAHRAASTLPVIAAEQLALAG